MNSNNEKHFVTKEEIIQFGLQYFEGVGASSICHVCIANGGSCCLNCGYLEDGEGCTQRNTSCTSWLCGFLKLLFYEAKLLEEWDYFWDDIPGKAFRRDYTPSVVPVKKVLKTPHIQWLGQALAKDLDHLIEKHNDPDFIIELNNELDRYLSRLSIYIDFETIEEARKELAILTKDFYSFQFALHDYRSRQLT